MGSLCIWLIALFQVEMMQLIPLGPHVAHIMLGVVSGMSGMSEMCPGCPVSNWTFWTCQSVILSDPVRSCQETCPVMSGKCPVSCPETCPKSVRNVRSCPEKCPGCPITAQLSDRSAPYADFCHGSLFEAAAPGALRFVHSA